METTPATLPAAEMRELLRRWKFKPAGINAFYRIIEEDCAIVVAVDPTEDTANVSVELVADNLREEPGVTVDIDSAETVEQLHALLCQAENRIAEHLAGMENGDAEMEWEARR